MELTDLVIKINREAAENTPDVFKKVMSAARQEGLVKRSARKTGTASKGGAATKKRIAILAAVLLAVAVAVTAIVVPVVLNGNGGGNTGNNGTIGTPETPETPDKPVDPAPHVHEYGEWKVVTPASCLAAGKRERECSCGDVQSEVIDALGHDWVHVDGKPATCTESGYTEYDVCSRCNSRVGYKYISASHTAPSEWKSDSARHWKECEVCGDEIAVDGHTIDEYSDYTCIECGYKVEPVKESDLVFTLINNGTAYSVSGDRSKADIYYIVNIPSTHNGKPITAIADGAFMEYRNIFKVSIPNSVTVIGKEAFAWCMRLVDVTISNKVTSIGERAFYGCYELTGLAVPDSVTSIGPAAFASCGNLNITLSQNNKVYKLDGNCIIEKATNKLVHGFSNSVIPSYVTSIGDCAFYWCEDLQSVVLPAGVTEIGDKAFYYCRSLASVTIPGSVNSIGEEAFYWCEALVEVIIPEGVKVIGNRAFTECRNLERISIAASVTKIGEKAFNYCGKLTAINYGGTKEQWNAIEKSADWDKMIWHTSAQIYTVYCTDGEIPFEQSNKG